MKKQTLIAIATLFTIISMMGTAFAWEGCGKNGYGKGHHNGRGMGQQWAQLTDDQKTQIKALQQKFIDETADKRASMISRHEQVRVLMEASSPDRPKIEALVNEIADLKKEIMGKKLEMAFAVKAIAPEIDIPMGFHGMEKFGKMGMGKGKGCNRNNADCPRYSKSNVDCPKYKARNMAKCPALQSQNDNATEESSEKVAE
ncbi:conserved exported hypothetical protein [Desulfamplus magnetovallimortis]|uniref:Zinc resistance-associated protein n=1 Tax=Desulfamplus magnetovallimortis TaxID=1246637 RepID=A0A1W1HJH8_9BACT|nr:Spy/CpxP family protein refolding chaperone [Desulfamplus magnetovallimortis]SLM32620.1 conserved exported hypothetical protein [Desulfamplus magnetovallimortis]